MILLNVFQWTKFFCNILLCFASKVILHFLLGSLWTYTLFLWILIDPDKICCSSYYAHHSRSHYLDKGYGFTQAYSCRYIILSCFQLHQYVDNGCSIFLNWFRSQCLLQEQQLIHFFFHFQSRFFLRVPDDGLLVRILSFLTWANLTAILLVLDFIEKTCGVWLKSFLHW